MISGLRLRIRDLFLHLPFVLLRPDYVFVTLCCRIGKKLFGVDTFTIFGWIQKIKLIAEQQIKLKEMMDLIEEILTSRYIGFSKKPNLLKLSLKNYKYFSDDFISVNWVSYTKEERKSFLQKVRLSTEK